MSPPIHRWSCANQRLRRAGADPGLLAARGLRTLLILDANVLIPLTIAEHEHHDRASRWFATVDRFALCPIIEGALLRFLLRIGESAATAVDVVRGVREHPSCESWPDAVSYLVCDLTQVRGHRQVTDSYLAGLAAHHEDGWLATMDASLASSHERAILVP